MENLLDHPCPTCKEEGSLKMLSLTGTNVTDDGIIRLEALPENKGKKDENLQAKRGELQLICEDR